MTKLEAYRAALSAAVRDGDRELAKALTRACFQELDQKRPQIVEVLRFPVSANGGPVDKERTTVR